MNDMREFFNSASGKAWRGTEELAGPTRAVAINLSVAILSNDIVGNDIVEAVGLYVAAYARFNVWYGSGAGGGKSHVEMLDMLGWSSELSRSIYEAWNDYRRGRDSGAREELDRSYLGLLSAIRLAVKNYCDVMGDSVTEFGDL